MQFQISADDVKLYWRAVGHCASLSDTVPGNMVMHKVVKVLNIPHMLSHQAMFKNDVYIDELLHLDLFQANDVIEYKVTYGRQLKLAGTIQLKGSSRE
ncbi:hypothetical protein [Macrococcoides caseolyticum]|uniref:hypothetical protein n=1 Tax=Macrococcoides caseolyticum TaxID=69966 RepID=UPI001F27061E|nr:hypothetical protein [Macrococcus caseolyticus]MCE4956503.1 hypothetical protein [Macrococcus caseolyticus]